MPCSNVIHCLMSLLSCDMCAWAGIWGRSVSSHSQINQVWDTSANLQDPNKSIEKRSQQSSAIKTRGEDQTLSFESWVECVCVCVCVCTVHNQPVQEHCKPFSSCINYSCPTNESNQHLSPHTEIHIFIQPKYYGWLLSKNYTALMFLIFLKPTWNEIHNPFYLILYIGNDKMMKIMNIRYQDLYYYYNYY